MPQGTCRLCQNTADLQESHIIPAFAYRWLRESSGNGHIRSSTSPNLRIQDGPQEYWLCTDCESRFGRVETLFCNRLFYPYLAKSGQNFQYGDWLLQFCTSVSWRVLRYHMDTAHKTKDSFSAEDRARIQSAEETWRSFLLGQITNPGAFRQHIIPFDQIESSSANLPPTINRYLMRAIQMDICHGSNVMFVFSKIGRFAILGFINEPNPNRWVGTKVNANQGVIGPREYQLPHSFLGYITEQANHVSGALSTISDKQKDKIEQAFLSNVDKIAGSDFFNAMQADVNMFGSDAFTKRKN